MFLGIKKIPQDSEWLENNVEAVAYASTGVPRWLIGEKVVFGWVWPGKIEKLTPKNITREKGE